MGSGEEADEGGCWTEGSHRALPCPTTRSKFAIGNSCAAALVKISMLVKTFTGITRRYFLVLVTLKGVIYVTSSVYYGQEFVSQYSGSLTIHHSVVR